MDDDVVDVAFDMFVQEVVEEEIHGALECRWGVHEAERHDHEFVCFKWSVESCSGDVFRFDADLVISTEEVELGEDGGALHVVDCFVDAGKREDVADGDGVQCSVVDA